MVRDPGLKNRKRHWLGQSADAVAAWMREAGEPAFRAKQFFGWLHGSRADSFAAMKNLPAALRSRLAEDGVVRAFHQRDHRIAADELTEKWLLETDSAADALTRSDAPYGTGATDITAASPDRVTGDDDTTDDTDARSGRNRELVECVLIIEKRRTRRTACLSSMIGCPLNCNFCATGRLGFVRNLTAGEIVEQAYIIDARLRERGEKGLSHIVYMGMGEPLLNLDAVLASAAILHDPAGLGLSGRHLTISTVGIPDGLRRLADSGIVHRLAVSLHAPNQKIRERILPAATRWPLAELLPALSAYAESAARDITFEYALIDGVNSSPHDARELAALLSPFRGLVNLIPLNPVPGVPLRPPAAAAVRRFQEVLENAGQAATVRMEKGAEIGAACGQLRAEATGEAGGG